MRKGVLEFGRLVRMRASLSQDVEAANINFTSIWLQVGIARFGDGLLSDSGQLLKPEDYFEY